jgi:ubiquinone/menaquinone biosynthesis C-methylase UbiE
VHQVASDNEEAVQAWDGPLFERFVRFRHLLTAGLGAHGEEALRLIAPGHGERALDIGCGFGETTLELAAAVGASGSALGVDASERFIELAREEAHRSGATNATFEVADVQTTVFDQRFELAYSRMGTMFFANPVAALRNVRHALVPGGRLSMVVWRSKVENEWAYTPQLITERFVTKPEDYDEPTCGPGPFSMGNADTVSGVLVSAGFQEIDLRRCDLPIKIGGDLDEAVDLVMSIGPAGEILRLAGERARPMREPVVAALREGLSEWARADGVVAPASTWIVSARVPLD